MASVTNLEDIKYGEHVIPLGPLPGPSPAKSGYEPPGTDLYRVKLNILTELTVHDHF